MKLAIIFGGMSYEHEISIVSAISMKKAISDASLIYIFVDKERDFYFIPTNVITSKLFSSGEYKSYPKLSIKKGGFFQKGFFGENRVDFDYAINLIHGRDGEDGKMASILEFFDIKFIGPRVEASVISYNKLFTKAYAKERGVKVLPYQTLHKTEKRDIGVTYPVIIKPLRLGSSIGVSIAKNLDELEYALDVAFEFDDTVLIEPFKENIKEYNLAGCIIDGKIHFSIVEEPQKKEFLDFDKKYLDFSRTEQILKADIDEDCEKALKEAFEKIYTPLFQGSITRCDFFLNGDEVLLNEINPVPGSMSNYLFENFNSTVTNTLTSLPSEKEIKIDYNYIHKIESAKGK